MQRNVCLCRQFSRDILKQGHHCMHVCVQVPFRAYAISMTAGPPCVPWQACKACWPSSCRPTLRWANEMPLLCQTGNQPWATRYPPCVAHRQGGRTKCLSCVKQETRKPWSNKIPSLCRKGGLTDTSFATAAQLNSCWTVSR